MTVSVSDPWLLSVLFFGTAVLYSSVGNAGASGYLAAMTLAGLPPEVMKSTALLLNIIVACITVARFYLLYARSELTGCEFYQVP